MAGTDDNIRDFVHERLNRLDAKLVGIQAQLDNATKQLDRIERRLDRIVRILIACACCWRGAGLQRVWRSRFRIGSGIGSS